MQVITTTNHNSREMPTHSRLRAENARTAMITALARVGGEAIEWNARSGAYLDTARLAMSRFPDARVFGRIDQGNDERAEIGVVVLIDSSGSMGDPVRGGGTRRCAARAIACGIVAAGESMGVPVTVGHHGASGEVVEISAQRTTKAVLDAPYYGSNLDAPACAAFLRAVELPARRNVFLLICDGAPCYYAGEDRGAVSETLGTLIRNGDTFCLAYIGEDEHGLNRAAADWGAARVADCRTGAHALVPVVIAAVAAARQR